jgi:hypothetical protein
MDFDVDDVIYISETSMTIRGTRRRTTVPKRIVERLSLDNKDRLRWFLFRDGSIMVRKVKERTE